MHARSARVRSRSIFHPARCRTAGETFYRNVESVLRDRHGGSKLGFGLLVVGAKLGAISGRRGATLSLCTVRFGPLTSNPATLSHIGRLESSRSHRGGQEFKSPKDLRKCAQLSTG